MKRATIVGDTTEGGAHPVSRYELNDNFGISIPIGRAVNPITKTNWEGTGIQPHFVCDMVSAKDVAYAMALDSVELNKQRSEIKGKTCMDKNRCES